MISILVIPRYVLLYKYTKISFWQYYVYSTYIHILAQVKFDVHKLASYSVSYQLSDRPNYRNTMAQFSESAVSNKIRSFPAYLA